MGNGGFYRWEVYTKAEYEQGQKTTDKDFAYRNNG